jgi:1-acyl-sn-glycerol-3-phosphate acyltransferase
MIIARSLLFWFLICLLTMLFGTLLFLCMVFPLRARFAVLAGWRVGFMGLCRWILGVRMVVKGAENIPKTPVLILSKHQSAWETVGLQTIFRPLVFVLKQELLKVPFFGWGLASVRMIGIDRNAGRSALKQMLAEGQDRLAQGIWVAIFPEGTRVPLGARERYKPGAAYLATRTGTPVLPVAHNAAEIWPPKAFLIHPGIITVSIGPLIDTKGLKDIQVNAAVENWIETEMRELSPRFYPSPGPGPADGEQSTPGPADGNSASGNADDISSDPAMGKSPSAGPVLASWVNGRALLTLTERFFEIRHAVSGKPLRRTPICGAQEVGEAVAAAAAALAHWKGMDVAARQALLCDCAARLEDFQAHFVRILHEETGKTEDAAQAELAAALQDLRGETLAALPGVHALTWEASAPLGAAIHLAAPLLRGGATLVLKPPHTAPGAAFAFLELAARAGVPAGVANLVQGDATTFATLIAHPGVAGSAS